MQVEWRAGHWDAAAAHAAAHARWSRETGHPPQGMTASAVSLVEAGRGNIDHARERAATALEQAEAERDWTSAALCRWVLGQLELSADDPAAALGWLDPVADMLQAGGIGEPGRYPFTPDLIEAWAATGQLDRAASRLAWLQDAARRLDHPWARITSGRAEAALLLARRDPAAAAAAVAAVIPEARQRRLPFELGRCLLVLGTAQRKARQRRDAAASLDEAIATFGGLGAAAVAGAGRGAAGPARARTRPRPDRRPSGASPAWWPPGRPTRRSPRPCTSASRPSRPTSPASTASSACAAGSTWPAAAPARPPTRTASGCRAAAGPAIAPLGETRAHAHPGRRQRCDAHGEGIPRCQHGAGPRSLDGDRREIPGDCERRPDSGRARPRGPAQRQRKAQTDEPSTSPRQAHHRDHGTGLQRPGRQCGRYPRGPCRDPPGSCHVRSYPGGFAERSAGSLLTMPLAPGRPAQNRYTPPRRRAGSRARSGPRRATVRWLARVAIASGGYPHSPAPGRLAGSNSPNARHRGLSAVPHTQQHTRDTGDTRGGS